MHTWPVQHAALEVRAMAAGLRTIAGYAAVFGQLSNNLGGFREKIAPGAFGDLSNADVRALWNHDPAHVLGRTTAGTLRLFQDAQGLAFEIDPPQSATAFVEAIQRGDVDQMSFGFVVNRDSWEEQGGERIRTLHSVELLEVSPVTFAAYPQTMAALRSNGHMRHRSASRKRKLDLR